MSKSRNNPLTEGLSGKLGKTLVFRNVGGETVLGVAPRPQSGEPTEQQLTHRNRFRMAAAYATGQMGDPAAMSLYKEVAKRKQYKSARTLAVADFFNAPTITLVDASAYTGAAGTKILIHADDELEVKAVSIDVVNAAGVSLEKGSAVQRGKSSVWEYTATVENTALAGTKIVVKAIDRPGNSAVKEVTLS
ncbi:hypothetical protein SAMN04488109_4758 [Chryseolinea serpens]|uniref:Uncharacterized protein n=1 Tax=Chryseolinea serpens TaxID=947013 RepID=A0A1M5ULC9_9BACT|nr:hypothetical protein [Chryseolinea serpens]SHH63730.1 hypothetical protein SAMN04488109_4758 [Chryseolinea serpens]